MMDSANQYLDGLYDICAEKAGNKLRREIIDAVDVARASPAAFLHRIMAADPREGEGLVRETAGFLRTAASRRAPPERFGRKPATLRRGRRGDSGPSS